VSPAMNARLQQALRGWFHLDSCQRLLWIGSAADLESLEFAPDAELQVFEGVDAYRFLLRVATGLESQIVGETDIFGQLKEAWRKTASDLELGALMQRLFEDTKDIRSRFLQNLGGASYGSLVRMMLKQSPGPTLVVGAGQLAHSVAPYLLDQELWIFNRSAEKLAQFYSDLIARDAKLGVVSPRIRVISEEEEEMAWRKAASVVVCIPMDAQGAAVAKDAKRVSWRAGCEGPVIHLGGSRDSAGPWLELPAFEALDDLFALQRTQGDVRMTQVAQAARACDEKAKLRALGSSVTLPHGWEDLAVFA
jgi:hypothetical protein